MLPGHCLSLLWRLPTVTWQRRGQKLCQENATSSMLHRVGSNLSCTYITTKNMLHCFVWLYVCFKVISVGSKQRNLVIFLFWVLLIWRPDISRLFSVDYHSTSRATKHDTTVQVPLICRLVIKTSYPVIYCDCDYGRSWIKVHEIFGDFFLCPCVSFIWILFFALNRMFCWSKTNLTWPYQIRGPPPTHG